MLAKSGLWVYPVSVTKIPCTQHGLLDAVDNPFKAYRLFMIHPTAYALGVPMGIKTMLVAIDVDPVGMPWLRTNWNRVGDTMMHRTPRGGIHLIYKMPLPPTPLITSRQVCDGRPLLAKGVDIQGEGRSIIWAGSPGYTIVNDKPPTDIPAWMLSRILRKPAKRDIAAHHLNGTPGAAFDKLLQRVQFSREGERNQLVFWGGCRAGELVAQGVLSENEAIKAVAARGIAAGLPEFEAYRSAKSGVQTGLRGA
jgi:hypothetical protein